jgi:ATP-binding cassette, subfamily B, bacterial PglK
MFKILYNLIPKNLRLKVIILLVLMMASAFLELISISLIYPVIKIILEKQLNLERYYDLTDRINGLLLKLNDLEIFLYPLIFLITIYTLKTLLLILFNYFTASVTNVLSLRLTENMFKSLEKKEIIFFLKNNSNYLVRMVCFEVFNLTKMGILPLLTFMSDIVLILLILITIFYVDKDIFIFVTIFFGLFAFLFYFFLKKILIKWGKKRNLHETYKMKIISEFISAFKIAKLYNKSEGFFLNFNNHTKEYAKVVKNSSFLKTIPRALLEYFLILFVILYIIFKVENSDNIYIVLPNIALLLALSVKLMPSVNRLLNNFQDIKSVAPSVDLINNFLTSDNIFQEKENDKNTKVTLRKNIKFQDISFQYDDDNKIFKSFNFTISKGDIIGIKGKSGRGKSTLIDILCGFQRPNEGKVCVDGRCIFENLRSWQSQIGYVSQDELILDDSLLTNVLFEIQNIKNQNYDKNKFFEALEISQLSNLKEFNDSKKDIKTGEKGSLLSSGQGQRINIARAIYNDRPLMIFDEATNALDIQTEDLILNSLLKWKKDRTLIFISHKKATLKYCTKILDLDNF